MKPTAANSSLDELDGLLRAAVEQIVASPPPGERVERVLTHATVGVPALAGDSSSINRLKAELQRPTGRLKAGLPRYLAAGVALALVVLLAVGYAMLGEWSRKKPIVGPKQFEPIVPNAEPTDAPHNPPPSELATTGGIAAPATGAAPDKRLGAQAHGFGATAGFGPTSKRGGALAANEERLDQGERERMLGNWHIINDDSGRRGEMWVMSEDRILMYAKHGGANAYLYLHRLAAGKDPKQIDITVTKVNGPTVGVIKGIYALDGDELRLCLAELDKDRPAAFPEKPKLGELLVLHRERVAGQPAAKGEPPAAKEEPAAKNPQTVLTTAEAIAQRSKESVTVEFKVGGVEAKATPTGGFGTDSIVLRNWGSFSARLIEPTRGTILRLGIEPEKYFVNKVVRVTGVVEPDSTTSSFQIRVKDLSQLLVMKDEPPKPASSAEHERVMGGWTIVNDDSMRKGEPWVVSADEIVMYANQTGFRVAQHFYRLDPSQSPKQIDITITKTNLEYVGLIRGIYELDSHAERLQWRLCLGEPGKDRPAAFPEKPAPGQVLALHHAPEPPAAAKQDQPAKPNKEPEVLTSAEASKQVDKEPVTVRFNVASVKMGWSTGRIPKGAKTTPVWWELQDGNNFSVVLKGHAAYQLERLRIDTRNHFKGQAIQATGKVQGKEPYTIVVDDLDQLEITPGQPGRE